VVIVPSEIRLCAKVLCEKNRAAPSLFLPRRKRPSYIQAYLKGAVQIIA